MRKIIICLFLLIPLFSKSQGYSGLISVYDKPNQDIFVNFHNYVGDTTLIYQVCDSIFVKFSENRLNPDRSTSVQSGRTIIIDYHFKSDELTISDIFKSL